jgi:hypothetical protein
MGGEGFHLYASGRLDPATSSSKRPEMSLKTIYVVVIVIMDIKNFVSL